MIDLSTLGPDEELGRRVSSRNHSKLVQRGDAPLDLFVGKCAYKLSVDRLHNDYLLEVTAIAVAYDNSRERNFYGWAAITQDVATKNGRSVELSPQPDNKFHADIVLPITDSSDKNEIERHASELAAKSHWQDSALRWTQETGQVAKRGSCS